MSQYTCLISYSANVKIATAVLHAPKDKDGAYLLDAEDTIVFQFDGPGKVSLANLFLMRKRINEAASPFFGDGAAPIPVTDDTEVTVDGSQGLWCFFMYFYAGDDGSQMLHFVPDPELQVGSIPNED